MQNKGTPSISFSDLLILGNLNFRLRALRGEVESSLRTTKPSDDWSAWWVNTADMACAMHSMANCKTFPEKASQLQRVSDDASGAMVEMIVI